MAFTNNQTEADKELLLYRMCNSDLMVPLGMESPEFRTSLYKVAAKAVEISEDEGLNPADQFDWIASIIRSELGKARLMQTQEKIGITDDGLQSYLATGLDYATIR